MAAKYERTGRAAANDRKGRWKLIEAIAADAVENGLRITSKASEDAAAEAVDAAGADLARSTVRNLCLVAKFDHESTSAQRAVWRRYGTSAIFRVAGAGLSQESAFQLLNVEHRLTAREVSAALAGCNVTTGKPTVDDRWRHLVQQLDRILTEFAKLTEECDATDGLVLGPHAQLGRYLYEAIAEKKIDAELRALLEQEGVS